MHISSIICFNESLFFEAALSIKGSINSAPGAPGGALKIFLPFNFSL